MIRNFSDQWKALKDHKRDEEMKVPNISKVLLEIGWAEAFTDFLCQVSGIRITLMDCLVKEDSASAKALSDLEPSTLHLEGHNSIE